MKSMKRFVALTSLALLMLALLAGCASGSSTSTEESDAASSDTAVESGIVVDAQAKTVTVPAVATGYDGESSIHFLVNEKGSNAEAAHFTTAVTSRELFDALEEIGAEHGDNIAIDAKDGTIEGSDLKMTVEFDGKSFTPSDLVVGTDNRPCKARFGGNIDINEEYATGCLFCMESCSLGITSNASYEYLEPADFAPTDDMPAAGTAVTITYAL